jgi:hypothetical protein
LRVKIDSSKNTIGYLFKKSNLLLRRCNIYNFSSIKILTEEIELEIRLENGKRRVYGSLSNIISSINKLNAVQLREIFEHVKIIDKIIEGSK